MYKLVPAERQKHSNETITKNAANHQKMACSGAFGTPGWARTSGLSLRRRPLYPTELRGLLQKIFNFAELQDSNDSIFRRRSLYPAELPGHRSHTFRGTARAFSLVIAAVYCIPFCRRCQRKKGARLMPCSFSICRMRITSRRTWPSASAGADSDPWRPPRCA